MTATPQPPNVAFITLGCPKNEVDSDAMRAAVLAAGWAVAPSPEGATVVVVNTCSFIQEATEQSVATVLEVVADAGGRGSRQRIVVAGCLPSRYGDELAEALPEVDAFVPVASEDELISTIARLTGESPRPGMVPTATRTVEGFSAYLKVSDGCHRACSYCTIPSIRGPYRSHSLSEIVAETDELVAAGAKEIVLIGQDISAWGRDLKGSEVLADVVRAVAARQGVEWLRLMYVQPDGVTDELLAAMAECENVCRYLDMPLQHASRSVLRAMRRSGDAGAYLALLGRIRNALPGVVVRTTVIAGFPGETRADVAELMRFIEQAQFDYVGVFAYSPEQGTAAALLPGQVPARTRRARAQRLRDRSDAVGFERAAARVGTELRVLIEGFDEDEGVVIGRHQGQAPEVDGLVLLDGGTPGTIVRAKVVDSLGYDLEAEVVNAG